MNSGRHFLQIPGPTNVPDKILRAIDSPSIDHRGAEFSQMILGILSDLKKIFRTNGDVVIYPGTGTGAWEAALVNTLSPGDKVLMYETGYFATLWRNMAKRLGFEIEFISGSWCHPIDANRIESKLTEDKNSQIKAICAVHNETSTGVTSNITDIRSAIDGAGHPALLIVDAVSSLGCIDYSHDEWGVDVTVSASQKGLMLPSGLGFNAISAKALECVKSARSSRSFWSWEPILLANSEGLFPYTPPTNLLFGLRVALDMLLEHGLEAVFNRHARLAEAIRCAVRSWQLNFCCQDASAYSNSVTAIHVPSGYSADMLRNTILKRFNMSLGNGLGQLNDKVFRIGHLGDLNELTLIAILAGVEMGLHIVDIPHENGGVKAAMNFLNQNNP